MAGLITTNQMWHLLLEEWVSINFMLLGTNLWINSCWVFKILLIACSLWA